MKTHVFFTDIHCKPGESNAHADWLGRLVADVRPDVVVCGGDLWDMESLCSYDKGTRAAVGRNYSADVEAGVEFNDRWVSVLRKRKRKMPRRVFLVGNHEQRIDRALDASPELEATIGYSDFNLNDYYSDVVGYHGSTPGILEIDGIFYAHYFVSGIMGYPIGGINQAGQMLAKNFVSCAAGHSHIQDYSVRTLPNGKKIQAVVGGCFVNYEQKWAGQRNNMWWKGVTILRNVEDGVFDLQFISLDALRREYGEP